MLLLPNNLACLAKSADVRDSGARWAVTGIQLETKDNTYAAVATDTKRLVVVEGPLQHDPEDYIPPKALVDAPNGGTKTLIPAKFWESMFKNSAKNTKRCPRSILRTVAVKMHDGVLKEGKKPTVDDDAYEVHPSVTMGWTNLEQEEASTTKIVEGRFPPYRDVIPNRPLYTIALDPLYLIDAVETLKDMMPAIDKKVECRVEIGFTNNEKPILMRMKNPDLGQTISVLVMPLSGSGNDILIDGFRAGNGVNDLEYWQKEAEYWKDQHEAASDSRTEINAKLIQCQRDLSAAKVQNWKDHLDDANTRIECLLREIEGMKDQYRECYEQNQQLENRCRQLAVELSACQEDKEMYRQRAETVAAG